MVDAFEKLKVYNVVTGALIRCSEEACVNCMCAENVLIKLNKRLEKLKQDLNETEINEKEKTDHLVKIDKMLGITKKLSIKADSTDCLMTKGICKLPKCIAGNISGMLSLVEA